MTNNKQKNIFLMPCGATKTREHLEHTVLRPVKQATIFPKVAEDTKRELKALFGKNDIAVWGSVGGPNNCRFFEKMQPGDDILFTVGQQVKVVGKIALKTISPELSEVLWPSAEGRVFSLIYFIAEVIKVNTPLSKVFTALGYNPNYTMQGLTSVSGERLKAFYANHKDILSLVMTDNTG